MGFPLINYPFWGYPHFRKPPKERCRWTQRQDSWLTQIYDHRSGWIVADMGVSIFMGVPKMLVYNIDNGKSDENGWSGGYPHLWKPPNFFKCSNIFKNVQKNICVLTGWSSWEAQKCGPASPKTQSRTKADVWALPGNETRLDFISKLVARLILAKISWLKRNYSDSSAARSWGKPSGTHICSIVLKLSYQISHDAVKPIVNHPQNHHQWVILLPEMIDFTCIPVSNPFQLLY